MFLLFASLVCVVLHLFSGDAKFLVVALLVAVLACYRLTVARRASRYWFRVSPDGVAEAFGEPIPWGSVVSLRDRPKRSRIDLAGPDGRRLISLSYEIESFDEALARVMEDMAWPPVRPERRFTRGWSRVRIEDAAWLAGFTGLGLGGLAIGEIGLVILSVLFVGVALPQFFSRPASIEVGSRSLAMTTGGRRREIELAEITGVRVVIVRGKYESRLDVVLDRNGVAPLSTLPAGADPFAVHRALRRALEERGGRVQGLRQAAIAV